MKRITTVHISLFAAFSVFLALALVGGCTLITDFSECTADGDCAGEYGEGAMCQEGLCVPPTGVNNGQPDGGGDMGSDLLGGPCQQVVGPTTDNPFYVGVLLPLSGPERGFGEPLFKAIKLAQNDFNAVGGVDGRVINLIVCDTVAEDELALEGARHLSEEAGVQAIIGPDFSSQTIDVSTQHTIPNEVVLVTPSGTARPISALDDNNLVWRTAPSDEVQGIALANLVEAAITQKLQKQLDTTNVLILNAKDDTYTVGLRESLVQEFGGAIATGDNFEVVAYGSDFSVAVSDALTQMPDPDVVIILGFAESWKIAQAIDNNSTNSDTLFFVPDAAKNLEEAQQTTKDLEGRILGTAPQNIGETGYQPYLSFQLKYEGEYRDEDANELQFIAHAFDALYVIGLGAAASGFEGPQIAEGMTMLSAGTAVSANQDGISEAYSLFQDGETVDYQGASGPLDFDENGDPSGTNIALWCFKNGGVPEQGVIMDLAGNFTARFCDDGGGGDMGSGDMGSGDMGSGDMAMSVDATTGDLSTADMGAD